MSTGENMSNVSAEGQERNERPGQRAVFEKLSQQLPSISEKTIIPPRGDSIGLSLLLGLEENESSRLSLFDDNALEFFNVRDSVLSDKYSNDNKQCNTQYLQEFGADFVDEPGREDSHADPIINVQKECFASEEKVSESTSPGTDMPCEEVQKPLSSSSQRGIREEGDINPDSTCTPPLACPTEKSAEHLPKSRRVRFRENVEIQTYIINTEDGSPDRCGEKRRTKSSPTIKPILKKRTQRRTAQGSTDAKAPDSKDWSTLYMESDESRLMKDLLDLECYVSNGEARFQSLEAQVGRCVQRIR